MTLPELLEINAFDGVEVLSGGLVHDGGNWSLRNPPIDVPRWLKPEDLPKPEDWKDPRVGWGLIAVETPGASQGDYINDTDLPQCLRDLLKARGNAPVFRYSPLSEHRYRLLRNWRDDKRVDTASSPPGIAPGCLPNFLMIWGGPEAVPWTLQYQLGASGTRYVGRLPLQGAELDNYVMALLSNWGNANSDVRSPVTWSPDHSPDDMTALMRAAIVEPLMKKFSKDPDLAPKTFAGVGEALHSKLTDALKVNRPGLIVTTSHGYTGPTNDADKMRRDLGLLIDQERAILNSKALLREWKPDGAIWYSHACCSAGCDSVSTFDGLLDPSSKIAKTLQSVASVGPLVSRLAVQLLGADKPARAFIGHVEPTFNWTLQQPATKQFLADSLTKALYNELLLGKPCGFAFAKWYARYAVCATAYNNYHREYDGSPAIQAQMLYQRLVAQDIQSLVLLGDPTVALPPV